LKISASLQLKRITNKLRIKVLQKSQIFHQTGIPIFASIFIYWRFFEFQYLPYFRNFGKNWK